MFNGTIVEYHRDICKVLLEGSNQEITAKPRIWDTLTQRRESKEASIEGELAFARQFTVGDKVVVDEMSPGNHMIIEVLPRETWLMRKGMNSYVHQGQLVVANADQLAVVVSPNPRIKLEVVDRYFLAAIHGGIRPLLVVNKIDLHPDLPESVDVKPYVDLGYDVFFTSGLRGDGLGELSDILRGRFTAFCGQSGMGKSTILSALTGVEIATGRVKRRMGTGRQTTVTSRMYPLPGGGLVVDTPGIRLFGLMGLDRLDITDYFSDVALVATGCRYHDCTHSHEPGCSVIMAVREGRLSAQRVKNYAKLLTEAGR